MLSLERQTAYRDQLRSLQPGWRPATEVYEATIRPYLRPGLELLDAGCGRGGVVEQLAADLGPMIGVDPDFPSLVGHRLPSAKLLRATAFLEHLPFGAASFDLAISSWVLEHLPRPAPVFSELARVLRPGGHLITLAPNGWHPVSMLNRLLARIEPLQARLVPRLLGRAREDAFPAWYRANTVGRLSQLAAEAGLVPVKIQTVSDPTYLALSPALFQLSRALERLLPARAGVHIVADFERQ